MRFLKSICEGVVQASGERILGGAPWGQSRKIAQSSRRATRPTQHAWRTKNHELKIAALSILTKSPAYVLINSLCK